MSTGMVARRLIELCRAGRYEQALSELYAPETARVDSSDDVGLLSFKGLRALRRNQTTISEDAQIHSLSISDPLIAGPFFTIAMCVNATYKDGARRDLREICVYEVRNDKIVSEQCFQPKG